MDFAGLAPASKRDSSLSVEGVILGTPACMALGTGGSEVSTQQTRCQTMT